MWDLPVPVIEPRVPCIGRWIVNYCTSSEIPEPMLLIIPLYCQTLKQNIQRCSQTSELNTEADAEISLSSLTKIHTYTIYMCTNKVKESTVVQSRVQWNKKRCYVCGVSFLIFLGFGFFWPCHGILVPWPGIKPRPPAVEPRNPNHWITREFPVESV